MVFITGVCHRSCWYCPLSQERRGFDVVYANEQAVSTPAEAVRQGYLMQARGSSITGGEPLLVPERVVAYCQALKDAFGRGHHIHLYTGLAPDRTLLLPLVGLVDELRLHPPVDAWPLFLWGPYRTSVDLARAMGFSIGVELPGLPGIGVLSTALAYLDFLNINELEWGGTNADAMRARDLVPEDGVHNAVEGSFSWATDLLHHHKVHWCSSRFKDSVQLRRRLIRVARGTARPFDEVTGDGTILYGVLEPEGPFPGGVTLEPAMFEERDGKVEMAWWILEEHAAMLSGKKYIIEAFPNKGPVVEVIPIR